MQPSIPARRLLCDACPLNHPDLYRNLVESGYKAMDTRARSIAKAMTYRVAGSLTTGVLVYLLGGHRLVLSAGAGALDMILKIGLYFLHERMWNHIDFGRARRPE